MYLLKIHKILSNYTLINTEKNWIRVNLRPKLNK